MLSGLVTLLCGATALSIDRRSRAARIGIAFSLVTLICASLPVVEAYRVAGREGVSLSLSRYLSGVGHASPVALDEQREVEFARRDGQAIRLDIYQPPSSDQRGLALNITTTQLLPAIIVIHGGSWRSGAKSDFAPYDRWLAENGGQLALLAAYTANDSGSRAGQDTRVRAVISFYGPTDLSWDYEHPGRPDMIGTRQVLENYLGGPPATEAQPTPQLLPLNTSMPSRRPHCFFTEVMT